MHDTICCACYLIFSLYNDTEFMDGTLVTHVHITRVRAHTCELKIAIIIAILAQTQIEDAH